MIDKTHTRTTAIIIITPSNGEPERFYRVFDGGDCLDMTEPLTAEDWRAGLIAEGRDPEAELAAHRKDRDEWLAPVNLESL